MTIRYPVSIAITPGKTAKTWSHRLVLGQIANKNATMQSGTVSIERNVPAIIPHASGPMHNP